MQNCFWDDPKKAESIMQAMRKDKYWIDLYNAVVSSLDDAEVLQEFYSAGESTEEEVKEAFELTKNQLDELEFKSTLSKEEDITRYPRDQCQCWRNGVQRLGCYDSAHVHHVGGKQWL